MEFSRRQQNREAMLSFWSGLSRMLAGRKRGQMAPLVPATCGRHTFGGSVLILMLACKMEIGKPGWGLELSQRRKEG